VFVESHPRRSPNSFLTLAPIPCPLSPNSDISPAAPSPYSAIPLNLLECALADKHRVLPVFSRNRPPLSPLECALVSPLISVDSKDLTGTLTPLECALTKNRGVAPSSEISLLPSGFQTFRRISDLSPVFSHSCALFCAQQKLNSFLFKRFRTLCQKPPGVVPPASHLAAGKPGRSQW
jgi:hypothetical protein